MPQMPMPHGLVTNQWDPEEKLKIIAYLRAGRPVNLYCGVSWCRFKCGISDGLMGCDDRTDGAWIWPEGLTHYVEVHSISLPDKFLQHARANNYAIPWIPTKLLHGVDLDLDYWMEWTAAEIEKRS